MCGVFELFTHLSRPRLSADEASPLARPPPRSRRTPTPHHPWAANLRSFLTLLVVMEHTAGRFCGLAPGVRAQGLLQPLLVTCLQVGSHGAVWRRGLLADEQLPSAGEMMSWDVPGPVGNLCLSWFQAGFHLGTRLGQTGPLRTPGATVRAKPTPRCRFCTGQRS